MIKVRAIATVPPNILLCQLARGKKLFFIDENDARLDKDGQELIPGSADYPLIGDEFWIDEYIMGDIDPNILISALDSLEMRR